MLARLAAKAELVRVLVNAANTRPGILNLLKIKRQMEKLTETAQGS